MIDLYFSTDLLVDDVDGVTAKLVERLGMPEPRATWMESNRGNRVDWLRVKHPITQSTPTMLEIIGKDPAPKDSTEGYAFLDGYAQAQGVARPVKTHSTVFAARRFDELVARLREKGIPHRLVEDAAPPRFWLGVTPETPYDYEGSADGGTYIEVLQFDGLPIANRRDEGLQVGPGEMGRIVARTFLTKDIDATLGAMRRAMDWPGADVTVREEPAYRWASAQPALAGSAAFELLQPTSMSTRWGQFLHEWGPGPHAIRIGVNGLDLKAEDLKQRGTPFSFDTGPAGQRLIAVDPAVLDGAIIEFVELATA